MDADERNALVQQYIHGVQHVRDAVNGLSSQAIDRRPPDGGWSAREVVHHLADSEMTSAIRLRRLLCEDRPQIGAYDEEAFARTLAYSDREIGPAMKALEAARETTAQILRRLTEDDWQRAGVHPDHDRYRVEDWLRIYAAHATDHAAQIRAAAGNG